MGIKYSVLDQSPVRKGETSAQALAETTRLAQATEALGYKRFWVSEHHNTNFLAGSTPPVLIAHLAAATKTIRIGSGGVMLPNHSSLQVAESFNTLTALYGDRIDLGIGRAPGTDGRTAKLLNPANPFTEQAFLEQLADLQVYFGTAETASVHKTLAVPVNTYAPEQFLLTSSGQSAFFAAHYGLGLVFAQFINPNRPELAIQYYRDNFRTGMVNDEPEAIVAIFSYCNEDSEKVRQQEAVMLHRFLMLEKAGKLEQYSYDDIKDHPYTAEDKLRLSAHKNRMVSGTPEQMRKKLQELVSRTGVNEVMFICYADNYEDRLHSYELIAEVCKGVVPLS